MIVNLKAACEAQMISNELRQFYRYYAHIDHTDVARTDGQMINSVNIQMKRINELKSCLQRFLHSNETSLF